MCLRRLKEHRLGLYTQLLLSGTFMEHLREIDNVCQAWLEQLTCQMQAQEGITEELKTENQMEWVKQINAIHHQVEESLLAEMIFT